MINKAIDISNKAVAYSSAKIAIAVVFGYSLCVMLYAIIRSSITIYSIMPSGERSNILLSNAFSIAYSVAIFSLLMGLFSSVSGAIVGVILKNIQQYFNPKFSKRKAIIISCCTALTTLIMLYLVLHWLLNDWMTFNYIETFSFWFLLPAIIYVGACIIGAGILNRVLKKAAKTLNVEG
jgi:hypothetical protein